MPTLVIRLKSTKEQCEQWLGIMKPMLPAELATLEIVED